MQKYLVFILILSITGCVTITLADIRAYEPLATVRSPKSPEALANCIASEAQNETSFWSAAFALPAVTKTENGEYRVMFPSAAGGSVPLGEISLKPEATGTLAELRGRWFLGRDRIVSVLYRCAGPGSPNE
jgi:hypothetical protein